MVNTPHVTLRYYTGTSARSGYSTPDRAACCQLEITAEDAPST